MGRSPTSDLCPGTAAPTTCTHFHAADQVFVAALVALALVFLAGYWANHALRGERLIDIDEAPRRSIRFVVNINQADWPELAQLPEIGQTLARRIVESRRMEGPFQDLDELRRVPGIGPRTLERMKPHLAPIADREMVAGP